MGLLPKDQGEELDMALSLAPQAKQMGAEMGKLGQNDHAWPGIQYKEGQLPFVGRLRLAEGTL